VSAVIVAADLLALAGVVALTLAVQPRRAWRDAAEHSRAFWLAWLVLAVGAGVAGALRLGPGWPATAWLGTCVALGGLQPSMLADLADTRRYIRRCRAAALLPRLPEGPQLEPICWHAPPELALVAPDGTEGRLSA
jgi:hypothetical protein